MSDKLLKPLINPKVYNAPAKKILNYSFVNSIKYLPTAAESTHETESVSEPAASVTSIVCFYCTKVNIEMDK